MKSIHSLWRKWNHLDKLIEKRYKTFTEIQLLSQEEAMNELKREFKDEYPNAWHNVILDSLANDIIELSNNKLSYYLIEFHGKTINNNESEFYNISFSDNIKSLHNLTFKINLNPDEVNEAILTLINSDGSLEPVDDDSTALELYYKLK